VVRVSTIFKGIGSLSTWITQVGMPKRGKIPYEFSNPFFTGPPVSYVISSIENSKGSKN
jgi:hypothetical protein